MIEAAAEANEELMEKYLVEGSLTNEEIKRGIRAQTIGNNIVPAFCGSAFKYKGVQTMLDYVMELMPSPLDRNNIVGTNPDTEEQVSRKPDAKEPFTALAFKIATDPFVGRLCFFRCYAGRLDAGSYVLNTRSGNKERISRIFQMHANKQNAIESIEAGDIGAAVGFKDIKTGDTLCDSLCGGRGVRVAHECLEVLPIGVYITDIIKKDLNADQQNRVIPVKDEALSFIKKKTSIIPYIPYDALDLVSEDSEVVRESLKASFYDMDAFDKKAPWILVHLGKMAEIVRSKPQAENISLC